LFCLVLVTLMGLGWPCRDDPDVLASLRVDDHEQAAHRALPIVTNRSSLGSDSASDIVMA
jgi:hypothetical protein